MKAAFTIITPNYISYAKTLADSVQRHNPEYSFFIGLIGIKSEIDNRVDISKLCVIEVNELVETNDETIINGMRARYNGFELSCALKPYFAEFILKTKLATRLKYIDSDIMVFNPFDVVAEAETKNSIFLTPHFFKPVDPIENTTNDATLLKSGVFNAGYFEVSNSESSFAFLSWWKERLLFYCHFYKSPLDQVFVDQSWLNLVPVYFKETVLIEHLGYNASFYNLHERNLSYSDGRYLINDSTPLVFFHFTGYKYYQHEKASIHNAKYTFDNTPFLRQICDEYRNALISNAIHFTLPPLSDSNKQLSTVAFIKMNVKQFLEKVFKIKIVKVD